LYRIGGTLPEGAALTGVKRKIITNPEGGTTALYGDRIEAYEAEISDHAESDCQHAETELRVKTTSSGGLMCKLQCKLCGAPSCNAVPKQADLPKWVIDRHDAYLAERKTARAAIQSKFIKLQADADAALSKKSEDWRAEYEAYRRTAKWQTKRSKVMHRANGLCEGCLEASATVVHHTTYANIGNELLFQLVALCHACHARAHPEHHEPEFYDNDYLPCFQCRWGVEGIQCGQFEVPTYVALEAGGDCGPEFGAFEGLK
jgi:hypothetical protein